MRSAFSRVLWVIAAVILASATSAAAGTLEVAPTTIVLQQPDKAGVLYVNNYGNAAVTVQIEPFDWKQVEGKDQLFPSQTLMSSPPIATIPAQGKQTVRLLADQDEAGHERCFRLIVSELPDPTRRSSHTIQVLTQFSIPVFAGAVDAAPRLTWEAKADHDAVQLTVRNEGLRHAKLQDLKVITPSGDPVSIAREGLNYILAGSGRSWKVPCARCVAGQSIRIAASDEVPGTAVDQLLVLER